MKTVGHPDSCRVCAERTPGALPRWFRGSHCYDCCASWTGTAAAHAVCCHRTFSSNNSADAHLAKGRCTDPASLPRFELVTRADGNGYWTLDVGRRHTPTSQATGAGEGGISVATPVYAE